MHAHASYAEDMLPPDTAQPVPTQGAFPPPSAPTLELRKQSPISEPEATLGKESPIPSFTASLLQPQATPDALFELRRFGIGLGLASLYGVALGARTGGASLFHHAAGVPLALLAVGCLGVPALTIVLTLFNAPISPARALSAASRSAAATGLVFGGLAPAAALFVVTSESSTTAALMALLGLFIGGVFGLRVLLRDLKNALEGEIDLVNKTFCMVSLAGFALFSIAMALRVWWGSLPLLKGSL